MHAAFQGWMIVLVPSTLPRVAQEASQGAGIAGTGAVIAERPGVGDSRGDRACEIAP